MGFPAYRKIDMAVWPRREHYEYYRGTLQCGYSMTARMDVTEVVRCARERDLGFFACFLYAASKTVNETEEMKLMTGPDGEPGFWEVIHPNFTVFHEDDKTFSDVWTEYEPSFYSFYRGYQQVMDRYGDVHGMRGRPDQPANFFCISCVPWLDFVSYATYIDREPALFPIITFGKYTEAEGRYTLPVTVTIAHASADGYHTSQFYLRLQENLRNFEALART